MWYYRQNTTFTAVIEIAIELIKKAVGQLVQYTITVTDIHVLTVSGIEKLMLMLSMSLY